MNVVVIATTIEGDSYEATTTQKGIQQGGRYTMVQRIFSLFTELPSLMRLGVLILVIGGTLDVLYHAAPPGWAIQLNVVVGSDGVVAHLMTLFGMVVTLLGLFARQASARVAQAEASPSEGSSAIEK